MHKEERTRLNSATEQRDYSTLKNETPTITTLVDPNDIPSIAPALSINVPDDLNSVRNLPVVHSFKDIFKDSLLNGLTLCGINAAINTNIFVSGTIIKAVNQDTLAAYSLIYSETAALVLIFVAPLNAINVAVSHSKKNNATDDEIARIIQAGWIFAGILTIPSLLISTINWPLLKLLQQESNVAQIAQEYFWYSLPGWLPLYVQFASGQFISGLKKRLVPLALDLSILGLSIFLTETFALGKFGAPRLDIKGYAISLAISNWVNMFGYKTILFIYKDFRQYQLFKKRPGLLEELGKLAKIGMPVMIAYLGEAGIILSSAFMAGKMGTEQLITQSVFGLYLVLLTVPSISLFESTSVLVSGALGAKRIKDIRRYILSNLSLSLISPSIALALTTTIPKEFMRPFIDPDSVYNKNIVSNLTTSLPLLAAGNIFDSARMVLSGSLLGMKDVKVSSLVNVLIQILLIVPLMYILGFHTSLDVNGLMVAYLIGSFILTLYTMIRNYTVTKSLMEEGQIASTLLTSSDEPKTITTNQQMPSSQVVTQYSEDKSTNSGLLASFSKIFRGNQNSKPLLGDNSNVASKNSIDTYKCPNFCAIQ
jgi:multidrug resistance protein, MATE family